MTNDDAFMALAGVRYCLGRHSYAPGLCCGWLKAKWPSFKDADKTQIVREIKTHIHDEEHCSEDRELVFAIDVETWRAFIAWQSAPTSPGAQEDRSDG